jgi:hypothetical protein
MGIHTWFPSTLFGPTSRIIYVSKLQNLVEKYGELAHIILSHFAQTACIVKNLVV